MEPSQVFFQSNRCILSTCNLNQWSLDFDGNLERTIESIRQSKALGAKFRVGPELELCGYGCEDHFLELDTYVHCQQSLAVILNSDLTDDILCDIGSPVIHNNVRYNCRVFCLNRKIVLIRPKAFLADDGNYREGRFFTPWKHFDRLDDHTLPDILSKATGQKTVKFGMGIIRTAETLLAAESCEELWTPQSPHIQQALSGVEIFANGSGSHHQLRKLDVRISLIKDATNMCGGVYLYANHRGCDGGRLYFDGCAMVCVNGQLLAQASQFSLSTVEVVTAVVDLDVVRSYRNGPASFQVQSSEAKLVFPIIDITYFSLRTSDYLPLTTPVATRIHLPEEECALGPACWLWDYLTRSGASGFLLPLSGGADSASTACITYIMCVLACEAMSKGDVIVAAAVRKLLASSGEVIPADSFVTPDILTSHVLHTIYLGTVNSSSTTTSRAQRLSTQISSYHLSITFDTVVTSMLTLFNSVTGRTPNYQIHKGTMTEDLALQNLQARLRMVIAFLFAQLLPWTRGKTGYLLVLGSSNVDEALRGYFTKYDCSSADINPIGGICKGDLKKMLLWASETYGIPALAEITRAVPTAELRPIDEGTSGSDGYSQKDEDEMGMTYDELGVFGFLRKVQRCGPVTMYQKLREIWSHLTPTVVAEKVRRFFYYYAVNRHKMTILTPSYHAENYSPDDNRFDLRQFLYNAKWTRQFATIENLVHESSSTAKSNDDLDKSPENKKAKK